MKTVVVANQKGGVGKSTLVVHLAHHAAQQGARVLVVDLDAQANSTWTLSRYATGTSARDLFGEASVAIAPSGQTIDLIGADIRLTDLDRAPLPTMERFAVQLAGLSSRFDLCVVDTAPAASLRMVAALRAADHVVAPIELETYSFQGITSMLQTIVGTRDRFNPRLNFVGMLVSRFNTHSPAHKAALVEVLKAYPHLVLPVCIGLRTSIGEAASARVPVWALPKTSAREAAREMRAALDEIIRRIGGLKNGRTDDRPQ